MGSYESDEVQTAEEKLLGHPTDNAACFTCCLCRAARAVCENGARAVRVDLSATSSRGSINSDSSDARERTELRGFCHVIFASTDNFPAETPAPGIQDLAASRCEGRATGKRRRSERGGDQETRARE